MAGFLATVDFSNPYFSVLVLLVIALAMSVGFVLLSQALGPKRYDRIKYGVYEWASTRSPRPPCVSP